MLTLSLSSTAHRLLCSTIFSNALRGSEPDIEAYIASRNIARASRMPLSDFILSSGDTLSSYFERFFILGGPRGTSQENFKTETQCN